MHTENHLSQITKNNPVAGAWLSPDKQYRYLLWRTWSERKPILVYVMLNPSTADERTNDPTVKRCISFAQKAGYGGIHIINLFAFRATSPFMMPSSLENRSGPHNQRVLNWYANEHTLHGLNVVFAWGSKFGDDFGQAQQVIDLFPNAMCLGWNKDRSPKHPLYLSGESILWPYNYGEPILPDQSPTLLAPSIQLPLID